MIFSVPNHKLILPLTINKLIIMWLFDASDPSFLACFSSPLPLLASSANGARCVVGFMGGIDLTGGRYDTASHSIFRTLGTVNSDDFYQSCIKDASLEKGGMLTGWQWGEWNEPASQRQINQLANASGH